MLNNVINAHDLAALARRLTPSRVRELRSLLSGDKVERAWEHVSGPPTHWFDVPAIEHLIDRLVTGSEETGYVEYLADTHLGRGLRGLSLGCGRGERELRWARTGRFERLDAFDLSQPRIDRALSSARENALDHVVRFAVGNAYDLDIPAGSYDLVLFESALHHLSPVDVILDRVGHWLKPGGLLIINEFVGPSRFQWTESQVAYANALLRILPPAYRRQWGTEKVKTRVLRLSRLRMRLMDPSEAAESASILPLLEDRFERLALFELGGSVVYLTLGEIAHHFMDPEDSTAQAFLGVLFEAEALLMRAGEVQSDFVVAVYRN